MTITYHRELIQGSDEWHQARLGLLTASEFKLVLSITGGGTTTKYRASGTAPAKSTPKRDQALASIGHRVGSIAELAFLADVSDGVIRSLVKDGAIEAVSVDVPISVGTPPLDKLRAHVWELAAQRISNYVEPTYIGDEMMRGMDDEILARDLYAKHYAPVEEVGFVTNDEWGFTLGCSPDGLVGADGGIEAKSRRQKFQIQTIVENYRDGGIPDDFILQVQGEMLVCARKWWDFISYSGGLHMAVIRVHADPVIQNAIIEAAGDFERKCLDAMADYFEAIEAMKTPIATERRIEAEMYA